MSSPLDLDKLFAELGNSPDENHGPLVERVVWVFLAISMVVVSLRIFTKFTKARRLYVDDILMLLALLAGIAHAVIVSAAVSTGFGRHIIYLSLDEIQRTMKSGILSLLFGFLSPMLGRLSFCCTLLFLTRNDQRMRTWPIWTFVTLQLAINLVGIIVFYSQCGSHLQVFWNVEMQMHYREYCWSPSIQTKFGYFMGAFNTVTDAFLAILPAVLIEHTRLSRRQKVGLWFLLCLSVLAMVSSIVKTYEARILSKVTDYTYNLCDYIIWVSVELNVVMITCSIPLLRPLFKRKKLKEEPRTEVSPWNSSVQLGSVVMPFGKSGSRSHTPQHTSTSSLDNIVRYDETAGMDSAGITVTREVEVSYESKDAPMLHAALVGLVQGEVANPRLART